jgi:hypothetical protein
VSGLAAFTRSRSSQCFSERCFSLPLLFLFLFSSRPLTGDTGGAIATPSGMYHFYRTLISPSSSFSMILAALYNKFSLLFLLRRLHSSVARRVYTLGFGLAWLRVSRCRFLEIWRSTLLVSVNYFDRDGVLFRRLSMSSGGWYWVGSVVAAALGFRSLVSSGIW